MAKSRSARLDRKKLFADPVIIFAIILVLAFLVLFIVYPLGMILTQSFSRDEDPMISELSSLGSQLVEMSKVDPALADSEIALYGQAALEYSQEYNRLRKNDTDEMIALKAQLDEGLARINADEDMALRFAQAVTTAGETVDADGVIETISKIASLYPELGKPAFSMSAYLELFDSSVFMRVVGNTLLLGALSGLCSTAVGFLFAYVDVYVSTRFKGIFNVVSMLPIVSPPFVLSLSMIMVFGRRGLITYHLLGIRNANIYGLHGILFVQVLTFFPVCYLMLKGLLANIDPSLEESSRNMGASRWRVFTDVTLPLLLPGIGNAFLVSFIESVADFTNPMMIGGDFTTLAPYIYQQISNFDVRSSSAMAVVLLAISMVLFIIEKYWLERKSVATLTGKASRARMRIEDRGVRIPLTSLCVLVGVFVLGMYLLVPLGAFFKQWGRDFTLVTTHFESVLIRGLQPFTDSLEMSFIAAILTAFISMIIAYLVVKRKFIGKGFMEFVTMFAMAVPGTVLGIALLRGYITGIGHSGFMMLIGTSSIIIIAFIVRSLPIGTRSAVAALNQIDKSIEESAYDLGAGSMKVFSSITLPLISDSFFSSLVSTFARSMTATSAVIFLISARHQLITPQIMTVVDRGKFSEACAYATIMMLMVYAAIAIMNTVVSFLRKSRRVKERA
ncbi:MAG: iron ABC transporter permease [Clostridia bacterium]|nr:iron ABC transporter permease [Clostridia bacterium]